jgi:saccharopine dehydrogenase-like NADP-dependent oxidoreductase
MRAALKVGTNYLDLCSYLADFRNPEQLKLHRKFEKEGLLGLINTGASPGITNLLAREAVDKLDRVSEIKIRLIEDQKTDEVVFAWSPPIMIDQITSPPLVYEKGEFKLIKPFEGPEDYEFPHPFGIRRVVSISSDEVATIPRYIHTKSVDYKSCGADIDFFRMLHGLGLFSETPVDIKGTKIVPLEFFSTLLPGVPTPKQMIKLVKSGAIEYAVLVLVVEVVGKESGKDIKIKNSIAFPELKEISKKFPGATYVSYPTGLSAVAFTKAMLNIKDCGVFPPEALNPGVRKEVLLELENNGIVVREEFSKA